MQNYIDLHTHNFADQENVFAIKNIIANQPFSIAQKQNYSIGLHPWYLELASKESDIYNLIKVCKSTEIKAIGEIGLDRLCKTKFELQIEMFERQLLLAEQLNKPVIIHCVRAFSDIISIKKRLKPKVPMIIHGFNQNKQVLSELIRHHFYISIGAAILNINSNAYNLIEQIPKELLFLETDDSEINIKDVYFQTSSALQISESQLIDQIEQNYKSVFGTLNK